MTHLRHATPYDAPAIADLLNRAYRPAKGEGGWNHERDLVEGERASAAQLAAMLAARDSVVLLQEQDGKLVGCIQAERDGDDVHPGMLAVAPARQACGVGKALFAAAENWASTQWRSRRALMSVIIARTELTAFYLRRGYHPTGQTQPYPLGASVGTPVQAELPLAILAKMLPPNPDALT